METYRARYSFPFILCHCFAGKFYTKFPTKLSNSSISFPFAPPLSLASLDILFTNQDSILIKHWWKFYLKVLYFQFAIIIKVTRICFWVMTNFPTFHSTFDEHLQSQHSDTRLVSDSFNIRSKWHFIHFK